MDTIDRRKLLTGAVLGATALVGATALGSVAPEAAFAAETDTGLDGPDPNFVEGRITGINGTVLTVANAEGVINLVRVTGATSIWKLRPTALQHIAIGDGLYARGLRMPDGTLAADAMWANIVNLHADITWIGPGRMTMTHGQSQMVGYIHRGTTSAVYNDGLATADLSRLRVGSHIQFIGAWRPDTDEYDIATIYA